MEKYYRKFVCSDKHFSGFSTLIDITQIETIDDIVKSFKINLLEVLKENNFENLIEKFNKKEFHIHEITIEHILTSDINELFYICHH